MITTLIVDDSAILRRRLNESLSRIRDDLEISEASTGIEALEQFSSRKQNTVILDISLPDISGIDVLKKIKKSDPSTRVIILTNYPSPEFRDRCINLGADYFFDKYSDYRNILELFKNNFA